jgi:heat shock protein HslJ
VRIAVIVVALGLAACGDAAPSTAGGDPEGEWELTRGTVNGQDVPIVEEQPFMLTIDGSSIGGTVCNSFGGRVMVSGGALQIVDLGQTAMACVDEEIMTAETLVMTGLGSADSITVEDGELVIRGPGVELRYVRSGTRPAG